jgi:hypothetical protein
MKATDILKIIMRYGKYVVYPVLKIKDEDQKTFSFNKREKNRHRKV